MKEVSANSKRFVLTRVMGFKPVAGGVAGPPELSGLIKEGDFFVGVSSPALGETGRRAGGVNGFSHRALVLSPTLSRTARNTPHPYLPPPSRSAPAPSPGR